MDAVFVAALNIDRAAALDAFALLFPVCVRFTTFLLPTMDCT
jgi:hypothetical protein